MRQWFLMILVMLVLGMSCDRSHGKGKPSDVPFLNESIQWADSVATTLTLEEKLGQLIIFKGAGLSPVERIRLYNAAISGQMSGLLIRDMPVRDYLNFTDSCRELSRLPLLTGTEEQGLLNNQFADLVQLPDSRSLREMADDSLLSAIDQLFIQQAQALDINWRQSAQNLSPAAIRQLNENGLFNFETITSDLFQKGSADSLVMSPQHTDAIRTLIAAGLTGMMLGTDLWQKKESASQLRHCLNEQLQFDGLVLAYWSVDQLTDQLAAGVDLFITEQAPAKLIFALKNALERGSFSEEELNAKLRKVLLAKRWRQRQMEDRSNGRDSELLALQASVQPFQMNLKSSDKRLDRSGLEAHFSSPQWELFRSRLYEKSISLVNNPNGMIPFVHSGEQSFRLWEFSDEPLRAFRNYLEKYTDFTIRRNADPTQPLPALRFRRNETHVVLLDQHKLEEKDSLFLRSLEAKPQGVHLVIVNFGRPQNLLTVPSSAAMIQLYERNEVTESLGAQLLFGAIQPQGKLPLALQNRKDLHPATFYPVRLKYGLPQEVGIDPARLVGIDAIAQQAIQEGVMPGCQVLVAKNGKIIYDKAFGHHTYRKQQPVSTKDLYDVASITKVSATTLALMRLYEEKKINLNSRLKEVIELPETSTLQSINIKKLMTHQSGLQIYMPVAPYLLFRDQPNAECDSFFCKNQTDTFSVKIADRFYFDQRYQEKIWDDVCHLPLFRKSRTRYSDVNFYLLQKVIEYQTGKPLDQLAESEFYQPLGLRRTTFNAYRKFDKNALPPTELDQRWRQQLVQGYVHDETAALLGGVAGHAGLFSTAEELAVLFQMLLNGGVYGGKQYFFPKTIDLFTDKQYGTSRGLGFDKPSAKNESAIAQDASEASFGHTGFTGACVWADPEEELIFIFLSNRVYPKARNPLLNKLEIRRRMHQVVYDALDSFKEESLVAPLSLLESSQ